MKLLTKEGCLLDNTNHWGVDKQTVLQPHSHVTTQFCRVVSDVERCSRYIIEKTDYIFSMISTFKNLFVYLGNEISKHWLMVALCVVTVHTAQFFMLFWYVFNFFKISMYYVYHQQKKVLENYICYIK